MEAALDRRIARVIDSQLRRNAALAETRDPAERERRLAHQRVVKVLPRLASTASGAVAELNDRISEAGLWLKLEVADEIPTAEAILTFRVMDPEDSGPTLVLSVDYTGALRALLCNEQSRSLVRSGSVFSFDRLALMTLLVGLLEARVH